MTIAEGATGISTWTQRGTEKYIHEKNDFSCGNFRDCNRHRHLLKYIPFCKNSGIFESRFNDYAHGNHHSFHWSLFLSFSTLEEI